MLSSSDRHYCKSEGLIFSSSGGLFAVDVVSDVDRFDLRVAAELGEGFV